MPRKLTTKQIIDRAKQVHGNKYNYSNVNYTGIMNKIEIICPKHGIFNQIPNAHLDGHGCNQCGYDLITRSRNDFIAEAQKIHNSKYDYHKVNYKNNATCVVIICPEHGVFKQRPLAHIQGSGCPKCGNQNHGKKVTKGAKTFINEANQKHGNKYDYSDVEYVNTHTKVNIICQEHGPFEQLPCMHLIGMGCKKCANQLSSETQTLTTKQFIDRAIRKHGTKYDYSKVVYKKTNIKVNIICNKHGSFNQAPYAHLQGNGCPTCKQVISAPERVWLNECNVPDDAKHRQLTITLNSGKKIRVDGFCPATNTVYEFYGDYWHGNINIFDQFDIHPVIKKTYGQLYQKTLKREEDIIESGYKLIKIWEAEWKKSQ